MKGYAEQTLQGAKTNIERKKEREKERIGKERREEGKERDGEKHRKL